MKTVWKFAIQPLHVQHVKMPEGAKILCVGVQNGEAFLWAEVDPSAKETHRRIQVEGTGHEMHDELENDRRYIGTFFLSGGELVYHVYERI